MTTHPADAMHKLGDAYSLVDKLIEDAVKRGDQKGANAWAVARAAVADAQRALSDARSEQNWERPRMCSAWKVPGRPSWDAGEPAPPDAHRCGQPASHPGNHVALIGAVGPHTKGTAMSLLVDTTDADRLRHLVHRVCHTPLLVAGQFVALYEHERALNTRTQLATMKELTNALEFEIATLKMANAYLRGRASEGFLRDVIVMTKHGPNGSGEGGPCDEKCLKCRAERMLRLPEGSPMG